MSSAAIVLLFYSRHNSARDTTYRQKLTLVGIQQLRSRGPVPVQVHCTEGRVRSEGQNGTDREGNEVRDGSGDGDSDGDGDGDGNGNEGSGGDGDGDGSGNESGDERREGRELTNPPRRDLSRVEYQALLFRRPYNICRQEREFADSSDDVVLRRE